MADAASLILEHYLRGELTLTEAQSQLRAAVSADAAAGSQIHAKLDELFRAGRLPVQVHSVLKSAAGGSAVRATRDDTRPLTVAPVEPTNFDPDSAAQPEGADATRLDPSAVAQREAAEATRLDPGRTDADSTA